MPLNGEEEFNEFLQVAAEKNMHRERGLQLPKVDAEDKVITLSTCTEDSSKLERFVVTAVLMRVDGKPLIK